MMKPDIQTMSTADLRSYVLENRDDKEAFQALMDRLNANVQATTYPCPNTPENIETMRKAIREKLGK
jgi:hypothetical protein